MSDRIDTSGLSVDRGLYQLVEEIAAGSGVEVEHFWQSLAGILDELGAQNRELLDKRERELEQSLATAQERASDSGHAEVGAAHLLAAILLQEEGVARPVLEKLGASPAVFGAKAEQVIGRIATVQGSQGIPGMSAGLQRVMSQAR